MSDEFKPIRRLTEAEIKTKFNVRELPAQEPRVESGPVCFGEDWTGLFLRGDTCLTFYFSLYTLLEKGTFPPELQLQLLQVKGLLEDLKSTQAVMLSEVDRLGPEGF